MPDKKLTDAEIVKALECCSKPVGENCKECPLHLTDCLKVNIEELALDLINRLQAENGELIHKLECLLCHATDGKLSKHTYPLGIMESYVNDTIQDYCEEATEEAKAEAYKEFAERLKSKLFIDDDNFNPIVTEVEINNLLKEMVGEDK